MTYSRAVLDPDSWERLVPHQALEGVVERREVSFPPSETAPRKAREFLRDSLATQNLDGVGDVTELLTTELVANVVRHVGSSAVVRVFVVGTRLRVEVDDASTNAPVMREHDVSTPSGNGLILIDALATQWGTTLRTDGKTVWFELEI